MAFESPDGFSGLLTIVGPLIAIVAVVISGFSLRNSSKALRLAERQEERRKPDLIIEYQDGYISGIGLDEPVVYLFLVKIINRSDSNTSITDIRLEINYQVDDVPVIVPVPHNPSVEAKISSSSHRAFELPVRIDARQAAFGWACFPLTPKLAERQSAFSSYRVSITDTSQTTASFQPILLSVRP